MDGEKPKLRRNPEASASFLSRITFVYVLPYLWLGFRKNLGEDDLCEPLHSHHSQVATERLTKEWEKEKLLAEEGGRKPSLVAAVRRIYFKPVALLGILLFVQEFIKLLQPIAMGRLIRYFRYDAPLTLTEAYLAATGVAVTGVLVAFVHHPYFYGLQKKGMELKVAACGMIMQKGLRLSSGALHKTTVGHIVTLMSNDVAKFDMCFLFVHFLWLSPLILISYTYMLWQEIGVSSLAGFGALLILVPVQGFFSRMMGKCRRRIAVRTDKRVSVMNEILNGIRVIKMYAWEEAFAKVVDDLRKKELAKVKENSIWQSLVIGTFWASGKVVVLFAVTCFILTGNQLTAERIFVAMALYNACRLPVTLFVPFALQFLFEARVSLRRIQTFLELEEHEQLEKAIAVTNGNICSKHASGSDSSEKILLKSNGIDNSVEELMRSITGDEPFVELKNFTAVWESVELNDSTEASAAITNVSLSARPGQLVAIVGAVGCGKSSLLSSILRETRRVSGSMKVKGRLAYTSQDAWIFSGTIRENILFGESYDEKRYEDAIRVCALVKDLAEFPNGDRTMVGDRGHSLSGGQKARVSLARAIYRNADIYLLDDPLSAVDSAVGRYLFEKCIMGFLKSKITILVTHQLQYLQSADQILLMRGGKVLASGTINQLKHLSTFADILQETAETYSRRTSETESLTPHSPQKVICEMKEIFEDDDNSITPATQEEQSLLRQRCSSRSSNRSPIKRNKSLESISESMISLSKATKVDKEAIGPGEEEERAEGAVTWRVYGQYMRAMAQPPVMMPLLVLFAVAVQVFNNFVDWWLNKWTNAAEQAANQSSTNLTSNNDRLDGLSTYIDHMRLGLFTLNLNLNDYQTVFTVMVFILMVVAVVRCIWFKLAEVAASRLLHDMMFTAVVRAKIIFFDKNPIGRILNRFSKDVGTMDDQLAFTFFDFFTGLLNFLGMIAVTVMINPAVFIPTLPLAFVFFFVRLFYLASSRKLKRLEATTRSPLYSHISAIMQGLTTVRAFSNEERALKEYHDRQDVNTSAFFLSLAISRWFAATIDWLVAFFITGVAFASILSPAILESGEVALMLVYAVQLTGFFSWVMRQSAELQNSEYRSVMGVPFRCGANFLWRFAALSSSAVGLSMMYAIGMVATFGRFLEIWTRCEINMVSAERIIEYSQLSGEPISQGTLPPSDWPSSGHLHFHDVSLRYEETANLALKNIEAEIQPKEKIGIVGRTGAGKSSLLRALFRLTEPEGSILIDGLDTKSVVLHELRKRLSIIPQDPVLFIGSLRNNLDPFSEFCDSDLWGALEEVELKSAVSELPLGLETHMQEGGANFSVGQRQLICLARALLRNAKIIVIDEATANVDPETDALIQRTIKDRFVDSTVLTIAHRLNTIVDSDRVMVLENGQLIEFDHAHILLQRQDGIFSGLVAETGTKNAQLLRRLAESCFQKKNAESID